MFSFGSKSRRNPTFVVGSSSLFSKPRLSTVEFGHEITNLGFTFGLKQFEAYGSEVAMGVDAQLLREVVRNPGFLQLLFASLFAGAAHCHSKVILGATSEILTQVETGVLDELRSKMAGMSEEIHQYHKNVIVSFGVAVERELRQIEEDCSVALFLRYVGDMYPTSGVGPRGHIPPLLVKSLDGLGTRFVAVCQGDFGLRLEGNS